MPYKIRNGRVFIQHQGKWWLDEMLFALFPRLKEKGLRNA